MLGTALTENQVANGNTAQFGNEPVGVPSPTRDVIGVGVVFILLALAAAYIFISYVLPESVKKISEVPISTTTATVTQPVAPTTVLNPMSSPSPYPSYSYNQPVNPNYYVRP